MDFYNHPNAHDLKTKAERLRKQNFNAIHLEVVEAYYSSINEPLYASIPPYSLKTHCERGLVDVREYVTEELPEGWDLWQKLRDDEITESKYTAQVNALCEEVKADPEAYDNLREYISEVDYPEIMFSYLYEASDTGLSRLIDRKQEEIEHVAGLHILRGRGVLNDMLFVNGVGYNFTYEHWLPLFTEVFSWINEEMLRVGT